MIVPADIRLRILATAGAVTAVACLSHPQSAAVAAASLPMLLAVERRAVSWRRLLHLEAFLALLLVTLPFTVPGTPVLAVGFLEATSEGLVRATTIGCKVTAAVLVVVLMLGACEPAEIGGGLRALRVPGKAVRLFLGAARHLDIVRGEAERLLEAMRARAFRPGSNRHTWASYGNLLGMLLVRALARAERVDEALRLRGFAGLHPAVRLPPPTVADWSSLATFASATALLVVFDLS